MITLFLDITSRGGNGFIENLATVAGFLYVTNIQLVSNFIEVLLTNPSELLSTPAVLEFVLLRDNIAGFMSYVYSSLIVPNVPNIVLGVLSPIKEFIS